MPNIFSPDDVPCGIFAELSGVGVWTAVSFARTAAAQYTSSPFQTPGGELLQSFINVGPYSGWLTPNHGGLERTQAGIIIDIAYDMVIPGMPDVRKADRAYIRGEQVEVVAPLQFGDDHMELQLKYIGR